MTLLDRASQILDFTLFQLGGNPITVLHVVMSAVALVITHFLARSVRKVLHRYLLKELDDAPRYVIVRFTQYLVWIVGIAIALELLNVDLTALHRRPRARSASVSVSVCKTSSTTWSRVSCCYSNNRYTTAIASRWRISKDKSRTSTFAPLPF